MNLHNVKAGTIIIAPAYLHQNIRQSLLEKHTGIINVQISTLNTYLGNKDKDRTVYEYYVTLKDLQEQLVYQKNSVNSLSFINELKTLITHMKEYQLSCDQLPERNDVERELKLIIKQLYPISLPIDQMQKNLVDKLSECKNILICETYHDIYEKKIYDLMESYGATRIKIQQNLKQKAFYYALNKRVEVESMAQFIIEHKIQASDIKISLLDESYLPYLKLIFNHYQIPLQIQNEQELTFIQSQFIAMLKYYLNPCSENAINLLNNQVCKIPYHKETIDYLSLYELDFHDKFNIVEQANISNDIIDERELKRLRILEEKAREVQTIFMPIITAMESNLDIIDVLCFIDAHLCANHHFSKMEERSAILQIREEIKKCDIYLNDKEDLNFLIDIIRSLRIRKETNVAGCMITDFIHPLPYCPYHFILGCTQENYPATPSFSGIFEERYYDELGYPSLASRYELHMHYFTHNLSTCEHVICFYPISTFDGKGNEASLELEQFMYPHKASKYPIKANYLNYERNYHISEATAKQLFLKEHTLYGSISSLEYYAKCPYAYFLKYGLRIEEPIDYAFDCRKAGTLSHYLMETLTNLYGKDYVDTKIAEVTHILNNKIEEIIQLYPNRKQQLLQMEKRLLSSIMKNLEVLKDHEEHSSLAPTLSEYHFVQDMTINEHTTLHLNGYIDRIDMNKDFFRIIDYKSSPKILKEEQVFSALQLQLITYLVVMEEKLKLRPLGAFYYSFANPNINMDYAKLKKRPLSFEVFTELDGKNNLLKEKKLSGWITNEYIEAMDDSGSHIKGVRNSKASGINTSTIYNTQTLQEYIQAIYMQLANAILSGDISCQSATGACVYCPYASICANANHSYMKEEMIEVEDKLYIKGGRKNA